MKDVLLNEEHSAMFAQTMNELSSLQGKMDRLSSMVESMIEAFSIFLAPLDGGDDFETEVNRGLSKRQLYFMLSVIKNNNSPDLALSQKLNNRLESIKRMIADKFGQEFVNEIVDMFESAQEGNDAKWQGIQKI